MVNKEIREVRCSDVLDHFMKTSKGMCFMTLTTKDVCTLDEIRARWRNLRHDLARRGEVGFKYVMNYELHPKGHGWHIHAVFNRYVNLRGFGLQNIQRFGFGRVNVKKVTSLGVSLYLSKHCLKAYRGVRESLQKGESTRRLRLVNTSRGLPRLSDYSWQSDYLSKVRAFLSLQDTKTNFRRFKWSTRWQYGELCVLMGWSSVGLLRRLSLIRKHHRLFTVGDKSVANYISRVI